MSLGWRLFRDHSQPPRASAFMGLGLALAFALPVLAGTPPASGQLGPSVKPTALPQEDGPAWADLTITQRELLSPLHKDWRSIDESRKLKWIRLADRFSSRSPEEKARLQGRMREWASMSPKDRAQARLNFQESRQLNDQERQKHWEAYQALPQETRQKLAATAPAVPASKPVPAGQAPVPAPAKPVLQKPITVPAPSGRDGDPALAQAKPGATTQVIQAKVKTPTAQAPLNPHAKPVSPAASSVDARPAKPQPAQLVDRSTLLPKAGPQAADMKPTPSAAIREVSPLPLPMPKAPMPPAQASSRPSP